MSIQQPRADVTAQFRGKFGALRRETVTLVQGHDRVMAITALIAF